MGLASYSPRFICDFASIASALHGLTNKGLQFNWEDDTFPGHGFIDPDTRMWGWGQPVTGGSRERASGSGRGVWLLSPSTASPSFCRQITLLSRASQLQWAWAPGGLVDRVQQDYNFEVQQQAGRLHSNTDSHVPARTADTVSTKWSEMERVSWWPNQMNGSRLRPDQKCILAMWAVDWKQGTSPVASWGTDQVDQGLHFSVGHLGLVWWTVVPGLACARLEEKCVAVTGAKRVTAFN